VKKASTQHEKEPHGHPLGLLDTGSTATAHVQLVLHEIENDGLVVLNNS